MVLENSDMGFTISVEMPFHEMLLSKCYTKRQSELQLE